MVKTALDDLTLRLYAHLLVWQLLDARPQEGRIKVRFDGKPEFCNLAGTVQGGILSAMLDPTMAATVFVMSEGKLYTSTVGISVNGCGLRRAQSAFDEAQRFATGHERYTRAQQFTSAHSLNGGLRENLRNLSCWVTRSP